MTTTQKTLITIVLAAAAGTGVYEAHRASHLQGQLQAQQAQQGPLAEEAQQLRQQLEDATIRLAALQEDSARLNRELAELPKLRGEVSTLRAERGQGAQSPASASASADPTEGAVKAWHGRVEQLKQYLAQNPQAAIPELQFLTAQDWASATEADLNKDYEYHQAMSRLRAAGETHFIQSYLHPALVKYMEAHDGQFPTDLSQLQAFFSSPVDEAILQRYEIVPHKKFPMVTWGGDWLVTQKAAVDADYDGRLFVGAGAKQGWGRIGFAATEDRNRE
jgi:hypothetical protein